MDSTLSDPAAEAAASTAVFDTPVLTAVSVKLPTFWTDSPEVWFLQAECQFENKKIVVSKTKYNHVMAVLPQDVSCRLLDLIRSPPADPYEQLKKRLIEMYTMNDFQRYLAMMSLPSLSDQRPSELMDKLLLLLPEGEKPGFFLKGLFLHRLPLEIRSHLMKTPVSDPRKMASDADELWNLRGSSASSHGAVNTLADPTQFFDVSALSTRRRTVPSKVSPPGRNPPSSHSMDQCWYHQKWGNKAQQCRQPCSFSGN